MTKWEYRVEKVVAQQSQGIGITKGPPDVATVVAASLNELGAEGWELVGVTGPILPDPCQHQVVALLYLKKPKA